METLKKVENIHRMEKVSVFTFDKVTGNLVGISKNGVMEDFCRSQITLILIHRNFSQHLMKL